MNRLLVGIMLLAIVCIAGSCTDEDEYTQGQWMKKASYNGVYRAYASGFTIGNYGYLCGGFYGANKDYLNDLWEYDMSRNSWTQCADMPVAGRKAAVGFAVNGKGYITTGSVKDGSSSYCVADTWEYDPATDAWTRKDDFKGGVRDGALAFSIGGYGYVGTGCNSDATGSESAYKMDFYRFNPNEAEGSQWEAVSGYGGEKRYFGTAFVIDEVAYICCGRNNSTDLVDFWKFDGSNWTQLRDIANTDSDNDYDDDYAITRSEAVSFVIGGRGFVATGIRNSTSLSSDYWLYDPDKDLWYGDSDDDFTPITDVHNYPSGASSRRAAVGFSTGERGFVLTGTSGTSYFDDVYELLPDEEEEV